ncbi:hypothetical protein GCM10018772_09430 [Streptomyces fumanus]|uniref:Uncharacterized protein n=1 Tax=Streptomyces fumanus TaxID=67302 RepID=A0A919A4Y3_9ACTN|nr:hypothetical protein GCM10018772_09430 [Streptomyces fumanus]
MVAVGGEAYAAGSVPRAGHRRAACLAPRLRGAALAAVLAGAVTLTATACDAGGGSEGTASGAPSGSGTGAPSGSGSGSPSGSGSGSGGVGNGGAGGSGSASPSSPSASPEGLEGSWLATTDGKAVALVVTGERAGLFATGGTVCGGTATGSRTIRLTCTDGNDDRAAGTVESIGSSTLVVDWRGGVGTETYTRAEGGKLPSGLPTAGPGS